MKDHVELKLEEGKAQLDSAKIRLAAARELESEPDIQIEAKNVAFWDGFLTAYEDVSKLLVNELGE